MAFTYGSYPTFVRYVTESSQSGDAVKPGSDPAAFNITVGFLLYGKKIIMVIFILI
jgi:hypothetical protein